LFPWTSGCDQVHVRHKPRLLSDNGSSYISGELAQWLGRQDITHVRGAPYHRKRRPDPTFSLARLAVMVAIPLGGSFHV
jgi:transposase InsO family protein